MKPLNQLIFSGGTLRALMPEDIHIGYVAGLNDPQVNRYLDIAKRTIQTTDSVAEFIQSNLESPNGVLWGIWLGSSKNHCGTIRLHSIDHYHGTANIGICIFDKTVWGRSIGSRAIKAVTAWAFSELGLRWIEAGAYEENIPSQKAFINAGYEWVFDIPGKVLFEGAPANLKVFAARSYAN